MRIIAIKKYIYLVILMLFCFSCTKEERSPEIKNELAWDMLKKKKENDRIELYYNNKKFELQIGDLICRKGHVDFYLGNNKVINWGSVHKTYTLNKGFTIQLKGFKSNYNEDKDIPFETIIRLRR